MMEVKEFIREVNRMCEYYGGDCYGKENKTCPLASYDCKDLMNMPETAVDIVENWSIAHPAKTHQNVVLEQYPNAKIDVNGVVMLCPNCIDTTARCFGSEDCDVCRADYWNEVVK